MINRPLAKVAASACLSPLQMKPLPFNVPGRDNDLAEPKYGGCSRLAEFFEGLSHGTSYI